ncbi:MAG TPA: zinc ABC transporter substrate-binding protein [Rhodocyclaceae bacterium]|nr:zinc ABC transporter substrate-binding protein [Rhodocyclaceae bacterium]
MKRILAALSLLAFAWPAVAAINVFATLPEWGALAQEIGGDKVKVYTATHALQDPHRIEAKPSLLAQARRAQLVVANGADLEIGWLPLVVRDSGNPAIQVGQPGYFEATQYVQRLEIPAVVDRIHGDVHPAGNPHIATDPRNLLKVGEALAGRLAAVDPANGAAYAAGYQAFAAKMQAAIQRWEKAAAPLRGVPVIVQHKTFSYLLAWLGMKEVATLEPKPGVEPTSGYLTEVLARQKAQPARLILRAAYQNEGPSAWMAREAKLPVVVLPYTVGGSPTAKDLFSLFDETVARLLKGLE